jgi:phosphoglycerate dehydrogenase-like enzyme
MATPTRVAVLPDDGGPRIAAAAAAVCDGGGTVVEPGDAEALVWTAAGVDAGPSVARLTDLLRRHPAIRWVQLPWAGVEPYADAGIFDHDHIWTCAKGIYAKPVAEHALALTLAGLRRFTAYSRATGWTGQAGRSLFDGRVTIFGGGGIALELVALLSPFRCRVTVVRKRPAPVDGARVLGWEHRDEALSGADAVVLALALTPETEGLIGARQLEVMAAHACLVNVARGRHVVTDDLVAALTAEEIGSAGLDVTEPEPLPDGHPLWALDNCLVTPHTANTEAMAVPLLRARIVDNLRRFAAGRPLAGQIDPDLGY